MRLLCDQDVYAATVQFLRDLGHDVVTAADANMARAVDIRLLEAAQKDGRVFVTRDRDFGALTFVQHSGGGTIYLRMMPSTVSAVHSELERVFALYSEEELLRSFLVVEPARHRIRRPPRSILKYRRIGVIRQSQWLECACNGRGQIVVNVRFRIVPPYPAGRGLISAARSAASVRSAGLACPCGVTSPAWGNSCGRASSNWFQITP